MTIFFIRMIPQNPRECDHSDSIHTGADARECNTCGSSIMAGWVHTPAGEMYRLQDN